MNKPHALVNMFILYLRALYSRDLLFSVESVTIIIYSSCTLVIIYSFFIFILAIFDPMHTPLPNHPGPYACTCVLFLYLLSCICSSSLLVYCCCYVLYLFLLFSVSSDFHLSFKAMFTIEIFFLFTGFFFFFFKYSGQLYSIFTCSFFFFFSYNSVQQLTIFLYCMCNFQL